MSYISARGRVPTGNPGDACGGLAAIAGDDCIGKPLFRVAIPLDLIPFATSKVRHEDRLAAILDGRS